MFINKALIASPTNWFKVNVMALTAFIGLFLVASLFNPKQDEQ